MDEYGSLQLGAKMITLDRNKKYPYQCYQMELLESGNIQVTYGIDNTELWSLFKGSPYFVENLLTTEESITKMNATTANFEGLIEMTTTPNSVNERGGF